MLNTDSIFKNVMFVFFFIFSITGVANQCHGDTNGKRSGRGYVILEINHSDLQNLNKALHSTGYTQFSENITGIGFGGHDIRKNRLVFDGYASWYFSRNEQSTVGNINYTSSLSGILGFYNIGYLLYSHEKRNINVFPLIGIGFGGMIMKIKEHEKRSFSDILEHPLEQHCESVTDTGMMFLLNVALGVDRLFITKTGKKSKKGLGAGIRLGYRFSLYNQEWPGVADGPEISFAGPYVSLTLGGGYNKR